MNHDVMEFLFSNYKDWEGPRVRVDHLLSGSNYKTWFYYLEQFFLLDPLHFQRYEMRRVIK